MKILRVITRLNIGGPAIHATLLHRELARLGHECLLVYGALGRHEGSMEDLAPSDDTAINLSSLQREISLSNDRRAFRAIADLIRTHKPDVVHTHTAKAGALARMAAGRAHVPAIVHTYHGHIFDGYFSPAKTRIFLQIERSLARRTHALIAISDTQRHELEDELRLKPARCWKTIPLGFDLDPFARIRRSASRERPFTIGWIGRMTAIKNPLLFVDIARRLSTAVRCVMVGDGELRPSVESRIQSDAIPVELTPFTRDMPTVYSSSDAVVCTSANEGTPVSLIEAMASGCAVIATDVGGIRDLMSGPPEPYGDGASIFENGILINGHSPSAFSSAIEFLRMHPEVTRSMGERGRKAALERFGYARLVGDVADLYEQLLQNRSARAIA